MEEVVEQEVVVTHQETAVLQGRVVRLVQVAGAAIVVK
jgi:hypothetical protein